MNSRVDTERICGRYRNRGQQRHLAAGQAVHLAPVAAGDRLAQRRGGPLIGQLEQALGVQRGGERHLDLDGGLPRAGQGGQPLAGDHVQDGDRSASGPGPVSKVIRQDPVELPFQPVRLGLCGAGSRGGGPSCRCRATACSVTVARSRSISLRATASPAASAVMPVRPRRPQPIQGALPGGAADVHHRGPVHLPLRRSFALGGLARQHRHEHFVLFRRCQVPPGPGNSSRSDRTR